MDRFEGVKQLGAANVFANLTLSFWTRPKTSEKSLLAHNEQIQFDSSRTTQPQTNSLTHTLALSPTSSSSSSSSTLSTAPSLNSADQTTVHYDPSSSTSQNYYSSLLEQQQNNNSGTSVDYLTSTGLSNKRNESSWNASSGLSSSWSFSSDHQNKTSSYLHDILANAKKLSNERNATNFSSDIIVTGDKHPTAPNFAKKIVDDHFLDALSLSPISANSKNYTTPTSTLAHSSVSSTVSSLFDSTSSHELSSLQPNSSQAADPLESDRFIDFRLSHSLITSHYQNGQLSVEEPNLTSTASKENSLWDNLDWITSTVVPELSLNNSTDVSTSSLLASYEPCDGSSLCFNATTLSSVLDNSHVHPDGGVVRVYWGLFLIILPILALFGNILVILSVYRERSLQTVTNWFIVSLALADLFVTIPMFFSLYVMVNVDWELSDVLCDLYIASDVICSTASIFNLVAISFDRFIAVTHPIFYSKHKNDKRVILTILLVWIASIGVGLPIMLGANTSPERTPELCIFYNSDFIIYSSLWSFYVPCLIMVILYYKIFKAIHDRAKKKLESAKAKMFFASSATQNQTIQSAQPVNVLSVAGPPNSNLIKSDQTSALVPTVTVLDKPVRVLGPNAIAAVAASAAAAAAVAAAAAAAAASGTSKPEAQKLSNCSLALISNLTTSVSTDTMKPANYENQLDHNKLDNNVVDREEAEDDDDDEEEDEEDEEEEEEEEDENDRIGAMRSGVTSGLVVGPHSIDAVKPRASPVSLLERIGSMRKATEKLKKSSTNKNGSGGWVGVPKQTMFTVEQASNHLQLIKANTSLKPNQSVDRLSAVANPTTVEQRRKHQQRRWSTETPSSSSSPTSSPAVSDSGSEHQPGRTQHPTFLAGHTEHQRRAHQQRDNQERSEHKNGVKSDSFPVDSGVVSASSPTASAAQQQNCPDQSTNGRVRDSSLHNSCQVSQSANQHPNAQQPQQQSQLQFNGEAKDELNKNKTAVDRNGANDSLKCAAHQTMIGNEKSSKNAESSAESPTVPLGVSGPASANANKSNGAEPNKQKKSRFNLGRKQKSSRKKKEKASAKRERKATKTLAIVLGVFLFCWIPFFSCNILDAICIKLHENHFITSECRPGMTAFLLTTWLGYMNSCANPLIYTIFNPEFRKAFRKILCRS